MSPNFARKIIHFGTRFQDVKKEEYGGKRERKRERGRRQDRRGLTARPILITRHVYRDSGTWMLPRSAAFLFLPDTNAFYYVRRERDGERRVLVPRDYARRAGERNSGTSHLKI